MSSRIVIEGWRFWTVDRDHNGRWVLVDPLLRHDGGVHRDAGPWQARCMFKAHQAPHALCSCGYRVTQDLDALVRFTRRHRWAQPRTAVGRCTASGRLLPGIEPGGLVIGDPPTTWRAEHVHLTGPLWLSPAASPAAVPLRGRLAVEVIPAPGALSIDGWLSGLPLQV